ncbi:MAG TPA: S-methyl-5'-thioadenosine phosphorylase [Anaerolineae bacterium]|nr:S-methyl-5'-thioadenosine phosphorylase [Anaerolineae bacterium]
MAEKRAEVGIFGGSGFYSFIEHIEEVNIETPYGAPSDKVAIGEVAGTRVAFLPRHGRDHQHPPHMINYRANLYAMKSLGVEQIIGPCASGSLQPEIKPGTFVILDQFVDRTSGRIDTFYDGPLTTHVSSADPYCEAMRNVAYETAKEMNIPVVNGGTVVVIQGPRFSTRAESKWFSSMGWEVINMTQYPEAYLARELEMCYVSIALITDYDVGLEGVPEIHPVSHEEVVKVFMENNDKLRDLLIALVPKLPSVRNCSCYNALEGARMT